MSVEYLYGDANTHLLLPTRRSLPYFIKMVVFFIIIAVIIGVLYLFIRNIVFFQKDDGVHLFSKESLCKSLIKKRVKLAKKNHDKHIVSNYVKTKKKSIPEKKNDDDEIIYRIMPKRRDWVHLGKQRYTEINGIKVPKDSVKNNMERLRLTILRDMGKNAKPKYLKELKNYIRKIQFSVLINNLKIDEPEIKPMKKKEGEARPLCIFKLKSNLILQEINRFLIKKYDCMFEESSFAFRGKNKDGYIPSHHDTVKTILDYRNKHFVEGIYVTECDLQKFFDTINHEIIQKKFDILLGNQSIKVSSFWKKRAKKVFNKYLECYDFPRKVYSCNGNDEFFGKNRCEGCEFKWIKVDRLKELYGDDYATCKIGIPQGGALSGFIANLVLDEVDKGLKELNDPDLLYLRYCDDMIMLHTNKDKLKIALDKYLEIIKKNKLFVHESLPIEKYDKTFYGKKSKLPYKWGPVKEDAVPWISFVGYQIGFDGKVRVRLDSINKEKAKQNLIVGKAVKQVEDANRQGLDFNTNKIIKSVIHRLQGMSVGHVKMYADNKNPTLCWANGFKMLNANNFSLSQMRSLDRNRCKEINILCHKLRELNKKDEAVDFEIYDEKDVSTEIIFSGKPFSYYNWLQKKD